MCAKVSSTNMNGEEEEEYELREEDIKRASRQYDITLVYAAVLPHCNLRFLSNALYHCHNLHILDIRQNKLQNLQGIEQVAHTLTMLNASENMLTDITNISSCLALECVFLEGNQLQTRESLMPLTYLPQLRVLTLCREVVISDNNGNDHDSNVVNKSKIDFDIKEYCQNSKRLSKSGIKETCNMTIMLDNPVCFCNEELNVTPSPLDQQPKCAITTTGSKSSSIMKKSVEYCKLISELFAHVDFVDGVPNNLPEIVKKENELHTLIKSGNDCEQSSENINNDKCVDKLIQSSIARMNDWCTKSRSETVDEAHLREILINAKTNV